jgi:hypothetical protein
LLDFGFKWSIISNLIFEGINIFEIKGANWNIDHAINSYYDNPPKNPPKNIDNSEKLFNNYKDEDKNMIGPENIERLCEDIGISPVEIEILIIVFYFKPK